MKIFGFDISFRRANRDQVIIETVTPSTTPISKIPEVHTRTLSYSQQFAKGRNVYTGPQYDLSEIGVLEDVESLCRQAFKKREGLMFKEGVGVKGINKDTVRYYKTRMAQIARATNIPEIELLKRVSRSLIRTSNAFLVKVRDPKASGGRVRSDAKGKVLQPIAGYFPAAPETMQVDLNENTGKIRRWRQMLPDGHFKDFRPEDVVHFTIDKREGFIFGVPSIVPVMDDIRALRQIEENIELLIYQHLFPLFHYKVGTETAPAGLAENGEKELDIVREEIQYMPSEGGIVTPERHEIKAIGSEGRALRAEGYLSYFRKRVLAGLGISSVDIGDAETSNKSTAFVMSRALVDSVKAIQDDLEAQWDHFVISELLLESTFGDRVLEEDSMVHLQFAEIDIQNKMDIEKHAIELFQANGITYDEFRARLGHEPIPIPEDPSDQDMKKYPEWSLTYWKLIEEPMTLMRSVDEPFGAASQALAEARGISLTQKAVLAAQQEKSRQLNATLEAQKSRSQQQSQNKPVNNKDSVLSGLFRDLEEDSVNKLLNSLNIRGTPPKQDDFMTLAKIWVSDATSKLHSECMSEFFRGLNSHILPENAVVEDAVTNSRNLIKDRVNFFVNRLAEDVVRLTIKRIDEEVPDVRLISDILQELRIAFDSVRYRVDLIQDVEIRKSFSLGFIVGTRFAGGQGIRLIAHKDSCDRCKNLNGQVISTIDTSIENLPPFHPHSRMTFEVVSN